MNLDIYSPIVRSIRKSMISGEDTEDIDYRESLSARPAVLQAFLEDDDLQEMTVVSTNIGFVRTYRKQYKKEGSQGAD